LRSAISKNNNGMNVGGLISCDVANPLESSPLHQNKKGAARAATPFFARIYP